jgi:hypothetical protein
LPLAHTNLRQGFSFAEGAASGGCTSDGFTEFNLNGPVPGTWMMVSQSWLYIRAAPAMAMSTAMALTQITRLFS